MFRIEVIGNIGADVVKRNDNGRDFYTFKVAHTEVWENGNQQKHERTIWVSCILNDKMGAAVAPYLTKGRRVYVRGRGDLNTYSSKIDRCIKAGCSISVEELELLGGQSDEVPRRLVDLTTGLIHNVHKTYFIELTGFTDAQLPNELVSEKGERFVVDPAGRVSKKTTEEPSEDAK